MRIGPLIGPRMGSLIAPHIGMAPPGAVTFIGASDVVFDEPGSAVTIEAINPAGVRVGDSLLMVIATDRTAGVPPPNLLPAGWGTLCGIETSNSVLVTVLRRIVGGEPPSHLITLGDGGGYPVGAVLLAYRGLNAIAAVIGASADDVASTAYPCPSQTLTTATDLYLGIAWVLDAALAVTPPVGTTERFDASQSSDGTARRLEVFEFLKGSTGATGTKTATIAAPHPGIAASIALKAAA